MSVTQHPDIGVGVVESLVRTSNNQLPDKKTYIVEMRIPLIRIVQRRQRLAVELAPQFQSGYKLEKETADFLVVTQPDGSKASYRSSDDEIEEFIFHSVAPSEIVSLRTSDNPVRINTGDSSADSFVRLTGISVHNPELPCPDQRLKPPSHLPLLAPRLLCQSPAAQRGRDCQMLNVQKLTARILIGLTIISTQVACSTDQNAPAPKDNCSEEFLNQRTAIEEALNLKERLNACNDYIEKFEGHSCRYRKGSIDVGLQSNDILYICKEATRHIERGWVNKQTITLYPPSLTCSVRKSLLGIKLNNAVTAMHKAVSDAEKIAHAKEGVNQCEALMNFNQVDCYVGYGTNASSIEIPDDKLYGSTCEKLRQLVGASSEAEEK